MTITKYNHSCLLLESAGVKIVIDPGSFSESLKQELLSASTDLNFILITHEHFDHYSPSLIKELLDKSPDAKIISNERVVTLLIKEGIQANAAPTTGIDLQTIPHQKMWTGSPCQNSIFTVLGKLTHPGDSFGLQQTTEILALPLTAPWGSTMEAVELALKLKPKIIIPIHDAMLTEEAVQGFLYPNLTKFFAEKEIIFKSVKNGEPFEV